MDDLEFRSEKLLQKLQLQEEERSDNLRRWLRLDMTEEEYMHYWNALDDKWNSRLRPYSIPARTRKRAEMLKSCWKKNTLPESAFHDWEILVDKNWQTVDVELLCECITQLQSLKLTPEQREDFCSWVRENIMRYG